MKTETNSKPSFRSQLNTLLTLGLLALAIVTSLTTAWVTRINLQDQLIQDGRQVTGNLALQSELALLYRSPENAEEAVNAAMGFPAVIQVMIVADDNSTLLSKGKTIGGLPNISTYKNQDNQASMVHETDEAWIFVAPVYSSSQFQTDDSLLLQQATPQNLLGYVLVSKSKAQLELIFNATVTNNLGITLLITILLLIVIGQTLKRLTNPLNALSKTMGDAERGEVNAYAKLDGPREVESIARAYNNMMQALAERDARLRQHNELLELEVEERTAEVVYARDMAIQANRNKSHFLSSVSHELRTPLQAIIGFSDLILETLSSDMAETRHDTETIISNANNLLTMINSILDMSKIESGRMGLQLTAVDLNQLLTSVLETIGPLAAKNNNQLQSEVDIAPGTIEIDEDKIRQIILNLLSNACKFTENGTITLKASLTNQAFKLDIHDTGIGMDQNQKEHIFEAFYQIDRGTTRRYQGTGLGLAISYQFCQLMGGSIDVESSLNKGSSFCVLIPLPLKIPATVPMDKNQGN